jgi:hypothetical protein
MVPRNFEQGPDAHGINQTIQKDKHMHGNINHAKINVGIGYSNHDDALFAGQLTGLRAVAQGNIMQPDLVLAFCSGQLDAQRFYEGVRSSVGARVPIIGGSAIGIITNNDLDYTGVAAGVALLEFEDCHVHVAKASGVDRDEYQAGKVLGTRLNGDTAGQMLLMFYDSVKNPPMQDIPPIMNASPPLIAGIESTLPAGIPIVGGGVLGDHAFSQPYQFCGSSVVQQSVVGALLGGNVVPHVQIMHGCTLKDGIYHTITRIDGPVIYEIDGQPAVQVIDALYGDESWREQLPVRRLAIGVNYGDKFGDFQEDMVVSRLIVGKVPQGDGIVLFEPDLEEGAEIQFMLRDGQTMIESAQHNARKVMHEIAEAGQTPRLALYIDCAGRAAQISDTLTEEAAEVQTVMNEYAVPLLGFYSGVEVAPMLGQSRGLDWTGVLLVLAEEQGEQ